MENEAYCFDQTLLQDGATPLHHAALNGFMDVVALLIAKKANVKTKDNVSTITFGQTLLLEIHNGVWIKNLNNAEKENCHGCGV